MCVLQILAELRDYTRSCEDAPTVELAELVWKIDFRQPRENLYCPRYCNSENEICLSVGTHTHTHTPHTHTTHTHTHCARTGSCCMDLRDCSKTFTIHYCSSRLPCSQLWSLKSNVVDQETNHCYQRERQLSLNWSLYEAINPTAKKVI